MYVCGPTVYAEPHIGNMRPIIIYDILNKLASLKGEVNFVHNITDVDDKIIDKAIELGVSEKEISEKYYNEYLSLLNELNVKLPNEMPKVSDHIEGMISFINNLIEKGHAYVSNESVYFSTNDYPNYAKLLGTDIEEFNHEVNEEKKDPKDFALWKKTDKGINWESPWGQGRPGWHTECAYFIDKFFEGKELDIHGGGIDLKFPHHINEMAQYETCCNKNETAKVWSYVGHLDIDGQKMSKSLGNIISAKEFIQLHGANTLRMIMIQTGVLNPISINDDVIENAKKNILKIENALVKAFINLSNDEEYTLIESEPSEEFISILENDLDIPNGLTFILNQIKKINSELSENKNEIKKLIANLKILGFEPKLKFNELKEDIKQAKNNSDYEMLDNLKKEVIEW